MTDEQPTVIDLTDGRQLSVPTNRLVPAHPAGPSTDLASTSTNPAVGGTDLVVGGTDLAASSTVAQPYWESRPTVRAVVSGPLPRLRIALVGEGAYPFAPGGVSLWCHQQIEGMPEHDFTAVALTIDGTETSSWQPPPNLREVVNIPLWGRRPQRHGARRGLRRGSPSEAFVAAHKAFLHVLLPPRDAAAAPHGQFEDSLRAMLENLPDGDFTGALTSNEALDRLIRAWRAAAGTSRARGVAGVRGPISLHDAMVAAGRIEHMLRALSHPPVRADVCHLSMSGLSALVAMRSKWAYGTPVVLSEHGVYLRERYLGLAQEPASQPVKVVTINFHRALNEAAYRIADQLTPHSIFNRRWQLRGGADAVRVQTMYNGINPDEFPVVLDEPDRPTIVFVGRIDRLKDLHTLIRAFDLVHEAIPDAQLRIFGPVTPDNVDYHQSCLNLVAELGLQESAIFEGRIGSVVDAYRCGHLVALTSVSEGFPFTVVEAMAMGKPPVCTNVGGVAEAVGDTGFVVAPRDHVAIAAACVRLLLDEPLRRELGRKARSRVLNRFTRERWADAYRDIYAVLTDPERAQSDAAELTAAGAPALADGRRVIDLDAAGTPGLDLDLQAAERRWWWDDAARSGQSRSGQHRATVAP